MKMCCTYEVGPVEFVDTILNFSGVLFLIVCDGGVCVVWHVFIVFIKVSSQMGVALIGSK